MFDITLDTYLKRPTTLYISYVKTATAHKFNVGTRHKKVKYDFKNY